MKFSIPYNFDRKLIEQVVQKYLGHIHEVYLPANSNIMGSGRKRSTPPNYDEDVAEIADILHRHRIEVNMLFNAACTGTRFLRQDAINTLLNYLSVMYKEHGINSITIVALRLATVIRDNFPDLKIIASTNAFVNSVRKAQYWKDKGANAICLDRDINKDIKRIRAIRENVDIEIRLLLNDPCLPECPYRSMHINVEAHLSGERTNLEYMDPFHACCGAIFKDIRETRPWALYSSPMVLPRYLHHYEALVDIFKISGRSLTTTDVLQFIDSYIYNTPYADERYASKTGVRIGMVPDEAFTKILNCDKACYDCHYCEDIYNSIQKELTLLNAALMNFDFHTR